MWLNGGCRECQLDASTAGIRDIPARTYEVQVNNFFWKNTISERFEQERELPSLRLWLFALQTRDSWISCDDTTCSDWDEWSATRSGKSGMADARSRSRCSHEITTTLLNCLGLTLSNKYTIHYFFHNTIDAALSLL